MFQGGHKPGKHGKPGKLSEFEKLLNSRGMLREILVFVEIPGKSRENVDMDQYLMSSQHSNKALIEDGGFIQNKCR